MATEQIGEIQREFKPGLENLIAGIIIGILMIVGRCFLVYLPVNGVIESGGDLPVITGKGQKGWCWVAAGALAVMGVMLIVGGILLIFWMKSMFSLRVRVGQNGIIVSTKSITRCISWDEIASVEETPLFERPPVLKGVARFALPKMQSKSFTVNVKSGEPIAFDANAIKGHIELAEMIREQTERRNIPWKIVEEHG